MLFRRAQVFFSWTNLHYIYPGRVAPMNKLHSFWNFVKLFIHLCFRASPIAILSNFVPLMPSIRIFGLSCELWEILCCCLLIYLVFCFLPQKHNVMEQCNAFWMWGGHSSLPRKTPNIPVWIINNKSIIWFFKALLSYDVASESEITPCNKIDKPLVVYRFTGNVMTSITMLRT